MDTRVENIVYIGQKRFKRDTVAGTPTVWLGYGDVQQVGYGDAVKLLMHEDVWITEKQFKARGKNASEPSPPAPPAPKPPKAPTPASSSTEGQGEGGEGDSGGEGENGPGLSDSGTDPVVAAIYSLDRSNPDHFSESTGKPKVDAVREIAGSDIKANDVNKAWNRIQADEAKT